LKVFRPAFSEKRVEELTGLSRQTLGRWRRLGIFEPAFDWRGAGGGLSWVYNYADVVMLRTLATLRRKHGLAIDALRPVAAWFTVIDEADEDQTETWQRWLWVVDGHVSFNEPDDDTAGQMAVIDIGAISADIDRDYAVMRRRDPATYGTVTRHRHINRNKWTVAGTGVMTKSIRELAEDGYDEARILRAFPALVPADITAALEHERALLSHAA